MNQRFLREQKCENCEKRSYIYEVEYYSTDGWDHGCSCPFCEHTFFTVSGKSRMDYVARKNKR